MAIINIIDKLSPTININIVNNNIIDTSPTIEIIINTPQNSTHQHHVYLLKNSSRRTYIGYTIDPSRRLRQHNGEIVGGAKRTQKGRPWEMVCYISGFPNKRTALQYEWSNNHPKTKRWNVNGRLKTMTEILLWDRFTRTAIPSNELSLTFHWLKNGYKLPFSFFSMNCPNNLHIIPYSKSDDKNNDNGKDET